MRVFNIETWKQLFSYYLFFFLAYVLVNAPTNVFNGVNWHSVKGVIYFFLLSATPFVFILLPLSIATYLFGVVQYKSRKPQLNTFKISFKITCVIAAFISIGNWNY